MKQIFLITVVSLLLFAGGANAQNSEKWDYPIRPDTEEWKVLKNHAEKLSVCQVPDSVLNQIATNDLIDLCLSFPMLGDIMAFNSAQDGIDAFVQNFNGIRELYKRNDFAKYLIKKYEQIDPSKFDKDMARHKKGEFSFQLMVIELLLGQEELISQLSLNEKKELIKLFTEKKIKKSDTEVYGKLSHMTICYAIVGILNSCNYIVSSDASSELKKYSKRKNLNESHLISEILDLSNSFIK